MFCTLQHSTKVYLPKAIILLFTVWAIILPNIFAQNAETWQIKKFAVGKNAGNDLTPGSITMANVLRLPNGTYRMYYNAGKAGNSLIRIATSNNALDWTPVGTALVGNASQNSREYIIGGASVVLLPDGRYRMYYRACPRYTEFNIPAYHILSAISTDGLSFQRESGVRMEIYPNSLSSQFKLLGHGSFFMLPNGTFGAFVSANTTQNNGPSDIYYANSTDGLNWGNYKKMYTGYHDPCVVKVGNKFVMYARYLANYTGKAESLDGINWTQIPNQIISKDLTGVTTTGIEDVGAVVTSDNKLYLFGNYHSGNNTPSDDIVMYERIDSNNPQSESCPTLSTTITSMTLATCTTCPNGSFSISVSGGTPPYKYTWDNYNFQNEGTFINLRPRNYLVNIKDSKGCSTSKLITVHGFNTNGNSNTESYQMKKISIGVQVNNEKKENGAISQSNVIKLNNGTYRMYYQTNNINGTSIKTASSIDGLIWSVSTKPILTSSADPNNLEYIIGAPSVVQLADGRYRLYYTSCSKPGNNQVPAYHIRSAISSDGTNFVKEQGIRITNSSLNRSVPLQSAGKGAFYRLANNTFIAIIDAYRNGEMGYSDLYLLTSPDGITWSYMRTLYADCFNPSVVMKDNKYILYCNYKDIYTAKTISQDGVNWNANLERVYAYDLTGKDAPIIDQVSATLTRNNAIRLYGNFVSGNEAYIDHIVAYDYVSSVNLCSSRPVILSATQNNPACPGCSNGVIIAKAENGNAPYSYSINNTNYYNSGTFGNLIAGNYTIFVKDARGCTAQLPVVLTDGSNNNNNPQCLRPASMWTINIQATTADVYWNAVTNATGYNLSYRPLIQNATWQTISLNSQVTSYSLTNLTHSTIYEVRVQAVCTSGTSEFTPIQKITTKAPTFNCPEVPLAFANPGRASVTVSWNYQPAAYAYQINYRKTNDIQVFQTTVNQPSTFTTITNLTPNQSYIFEIRALCNGGLFSGAKVVMATPRAGRESNNFENINYQLYPNPANSQFTLDITDDSNTDKQLFIYNLNGQVVTEQNIPSGSNKTVISTQDLNEGVYIIKLYAQNQIAFTQKLIVLRQ